MSLLQTKHQYMLHMIYSNYEVFSLTWKFMRCISFSDIMLFLFIMFAMKDTLLVSMCNY